MKNLSIVCTMQRVSKVSAFENSVEIDETNEKLQPKRKEYNNRNLNGIKSSFWCMVSKRCKQTSIHMCVCVYHLVFRINCA